MKFVRARTNTVLMGLKPRNLLLARVKELYNSIATVGDGCDLASSTSEGSLPPPVPSCSIW